MAKRGLENFVEYPALVLSDAEGTLTAKIAFPFRHLNFSFTIEVSRALYEGARSSAKAARVPAGIQDAWMQKYYEAFALSPLLEPFYKTLLAGMRKIRCEQNLTPDEYVELLTAYVQSIPYDHEKEASIERAPRYPVETVVENTGICSDKTVLLAGLLSHEGYACAVLHFARENHVTAGLPAPEGFDFMGCGYAVAETTAISYIGAASSEYGVCENRPKVFPIGHGTKTYGGIRDTVKILAVMRELEESIAAGSPLYNEIVFVQKKIEAMKEELTVSKKEIERKANAGEDYYPLLSEHKKNVAKLESLIQRYNRLADDFKANAELAGFIYHNRLDRRSVVRRLKSIGRL
ncbi:MAG TPA: hypothetical protein O0X39_04905 [Methanocorpusculum sp.]|nr:hypothetical protein [Methanocorpusculum sp.]